MLHVSKDGKSLEAYVMATSKRTDEHGLRFDAFESELKALRYLVESGMARGLGNAVSSESGNPSDLRTALAIHKRQSIVVVGFERDTDKNVIDERGRKGVRQESS